MPEYDVGPDDGFELRQVGITGCEVLIARIEGRLHGTAALCPHAGAPLAEGVLHDGVITCPWHKAAFDLRSGVCTAPPAVDDLPVFPVRVEAGRVLVNLPATLPAWPAGSEDRRCFVVVGAGAAGQQAAQTLRAEGFGGRIVLISPEEALPYDRTVLSKYALSGQPGAEKSPLQSAYFYQRHGIERRLGRVAAVDPAGRVLTFEDGERLGYDAALLAPGGSAQRPDIRGMELDGVFTLRSAADSAAIAEQARGARRCVVLGAGFIGMEAAAALRERGLEVTVVAQEWAAFEAALGAEVGEAVAGLHRAQGIGFRLGRKAVALHGEGQVSGVELDDGSVVAAELVVIGMGIAPNSGMLPAGLVGKDGGVDVDAGLRVCAGLYAGGDVARFPLYGEGDRVRVEHWRVALQHGRVAALNMLGGQARFAAAPYFWTIHFMKRLDYVGHAGAWDGVLIDGDTQAPRFLAYYLEGTRVRAVAGIDRDQAMATCVRLFDERQDWGLEELRGLLG